MTQNQRLLAIAAIVFFATLLAYWQFDLPDYGNTSDNLWYVPTALSILHQGNVELSEYKDRITQYKGFGIRWIHGSPYNLYPVGTSLISLPFIFLAEKLYDNADSESQLFSIAAAVAKIIAAISVALLFLLVFRLTGKLSIALVLAALFGFATTQLAIHAGGLWSHNVALPFLLVALVCLSSASVSPATDSRRDGGATTTRHVWLSALPLALAYIARPTMSIAIIWVVVYIFLYDRKSLLPFVLLGGAIGLGFMLFSYRVYYQALPPYYVGTQIVATSFFQALAAHMVSPNRGLLIFTPIFIASFYGIYLSFRNYSNVSHFYRLLSVMAISQWFLICCLRNWWGGNSVGPRLFSEMLPVWILLLIPPYQQLQVVSTGDRRIAYLLFGIAAAWSFVVQYRTATDFEVRLWNRTPVRVDFKPERVWDWNDMQIFRTAKKRLQLNGDPAPLSESSE